MTNENAPRGVVRRLLRSAGDDLADEFKFALVTVVFLGAGIGVGYAIGGEEGILPGALAGATLLGLSLAVVAVRWVAEIVRNVQRGRCRS